MVATFLPVGETIPISLFPVTGYKPTPPNKYTFSGRLGGKPLFYVMAENAKIEITSTWNEKFKIGEVYIWDYLISAKRCGVLIIDDITYDEVVVTYSPTFIHATTGRVCTMSMTFELVSGS